MLAGLNYKLSDEGRQALADYIPARRGQSHFANARSIRNAIDRARLRQANRHFCERGKALSVDDLMTIEAADIRQSRVFLDQGKPS